MHFQTLICATPASGVRAAGLRESARKVRLMFAENDREACLLAGKAGTVTLLAIIVESRAKDKRCPGPGATDVIMIMKARSFREAGQLPCVGVAKWRIRTGLRVIFLALARPARIEQG